jgi:hypothetical protein
MADDRLAVLNPMGHPPTTQQLGMAPRPASLEGRTVYLVDCRFDDGDILMRQMADWFGEHLPGTRVEVRRKSDVYTKRDDTLYEEIKHTGDAAIIGVGH